MDLQSMKSRSESHQELHDSAINDLLDLMHPFEQSVVPIRDERFLSKSADQQIKQYSLYLENEAKDFEKRASFSKTLHGAYVYDCMLESNNQRDLQSQRELIKPKSTLNQEVKTMSTIAPMTTSSQARFLKNFSNSNPNFNSSSNISLHEPLKAKTEVQSVLNESLAESFSDSNFGSECHPARTMLDFTILACPKTYSNSNFNCGNTIENLLDSQIKTLNKYQEPIQSASSQKSAPTSPSLDIQNNRLCLPITATNKTSPTEIIIDDKISKIQLSSNIQESKSLDSCRPFIENQKRTDDSLQHLKSTNSDISSYSPSIDSISRYMDSSEALSVSFINGSAIYPIKTSDFKAIMTYLTKNKTAKKHPPVPKYISNNLNKPTSSLNVSQVQHETQRCFPSISPGQNYPNSNITTQSVSDLQAQKIKRLIHFEHSYAKMACSHSSPSPKSEQIKSPQKREIYEEIPRHRCSPSKSGRNKRREHMHDGHHKRERNERGESQNPSRSHGVNIGVGGLLVLPNISNNINLGNSGNVGVSSGSAGRNSPAINDVNPVNSNHAGLLAATAANSIGLGNGVVNSGSKSPSLDYLTPPSVSSSSTANAIVSQAAISKKILEEEKCSGYNSGDEYIPTKEKAVTAAEWKRRDEQFISTMADLGYEVRQVEEDGACLFRAISLQIYGDEDSHDVIRQRTMDYIYKNREYFSHFVTEDFDEYIKRKRRKDSHGNHIEIQAMSEIYGRPVEVYCYKPKPINIFNSEQRNGYAPLRLSYQRWSHYNAIIDPYNATVGVGLGFANYHPQLQTKEAVRLSEQLEIEQTMFEDKLKTTDWEATNEVIEEQVARESYLQWCRENMQRNRSVVTRSATSTITSAQANDKSGGIDESCDEIASPSKYSTSFNNNMSLSLAGAANSDISNNMLSSSSPSLSATRKLNFASEKQCNAEGGAGVNMMVSGGGGNNGGGGNASPGSGNVKKLSALVTNYDSDDTDISTSSSLNDNKGTGTSGPQSPGRSKKMKTRFNSKKRRHEQLLRQNEKNDETLTGGHPNHEGASGLGLGGGDSSNNSGLVKGAKSDMSMSQNFKHIKDGSPVGTVDTEQPCSSKCVQHSNTNDGDNVMQGDNSTSAAFSSFYQDLLQSSYTTDGYGQLTEAEMLQRAIQMSTQDYIEDQKRKYLYGP